MWKAKGEAKNMNLWAVFVGKRRYRGELTKSHAALIKNSLTGHVNQVRTRWEYESPGEEYM